MQKSIIIFLVVMTLTAVVLGQKKKGRHGGWIPARCLKPHPKNKPNNCRPNQKEAIWYFNGVNNCQQTRPGCYRLGAKDNGFKSRKVCMNTCDK